MTPEQMAAMLQEAKDQKTAQATESAYNKSLTTTEPAPKKAERRGDEKPVKKYAKGGYVRAADGIASKGKTKGRMI